MNADTISGLRTAYGFDFGAATVEALASDEKRGWVLIGVSTPKTKVQVYVTKTGKTRVYINSVEMVAPE